MELHELSISQLGSLIKNKEVSIPKLTRYMLDRIEKLDSAYGCYITVAEEKAMEQAADVQARLDGGNLDSPLAGIPMAQEYLHERDTYHLCFQDALQFYPAI